MSPAKKKTKSRATKETAVKKPAAKKTKAPEKKKSSPAKPKAEKKKPAAKAKPAKGALDRAKETVKKGVAAIAKSMKSAPPKPVAEKKKPAEKAAKPEKPAKKEKAASAPRKKPTNVRAATPIQTTQFGNKYICFACQAKFYDLNRPDPICPKCGADQNLMPKEEIKIPKKPAEKKPRAMNTFYDDDEVASEEVDPGIKDADLGFEDEFLDDMVDEEVVEEEEEL